MPVIPPGTSYDYVSGCPLDTPSGMMEGHYQLVDNEGETLEAAIPRFSLLTPTA
jgi:ApaG protein